MPPPLVAHVNLARGFRGGERQTELLVRELASNGWRQRLVARRGEPLAARLAGVAGLEIPSIGPTVLSAALALRGAALVHVHEARGLQAAFINRLAGGAPYLVTRRVQQGPSQHGLNRAMYARAAAVVALSRAIVGSLRALDSSLQPVVIPSAGAGFVADPRRVAAIRDGLHAEFVAGHVGALVDSHKGQRQILAMARETAPSDPGLVYLLVGDGPDGAALRAEAAGLDNLRFAGQVADVGDHLAACDLFLYPSRHEGLGSVLLDAMAAGLPIVATRVGGIPEIVREGVNGLLCEVDDIAGLTAAVLTLRADPGLRDRMAAANRARALEFSPRAMAKRYEDIYRGLLTGARGVPGST